MYRGYVHDIFCKELHQHHLIIYNLYVFTASDDTERGKERKESYLSWSQVDQTGKMFSFRGGQIFLLLEPSLQLVNLTNNISYITRR